MSRLAASQIPKPADEQAFERASVVLWQRLLGDPNVQRVGRRGQAQNGVDLVGCRNGDPEHLVGIQCKLKGDGKQLTEDEVRHEVTEALGFTPPLREYFITTTAPDSNHLQALARTLTVEQHQAGRLLKIYVWGWNTLEENISDDPKARTSFDPTFTPFGAQLSGEVAAMRLSQVQIAETTHDRMDLLHADVRAILQRGAPVGGIDDETHRVAVEAALDASIDDIRETLNRGDPAVAQTLFESLLARVRDTASGRILFRIEANIGACRLALGDESEAAARLISAFDHAPSEPKAITNKVLGLMLRGDWAAAYALGREGLEVDSATDALAAYVVQAAQFEAAVEEPLSVVPSRFHGSALVRAAATDFLRQRDRMEWRDAARALLADHGENPHARRLAAEADLDEILNTPDFSRRRMLSVEQRDRVRQATDQLKSLWDTAVADQKGAPRSETAGLCANLLVGLHALDDMEMAVTVAKEGADIFPDDPELARYCALVAVDAGVGDLVETLLPRLADDPSARVILFRHYANRYEWTKLAELQREPGPPPPAEEAPIVEVLGRIALLKTEAAADFAGGLQALLAEVTEDPRAAVIIAGVAADEGLEELSEAAYRTARALITPDSHIARRLMVAALANRREDWSVVADVLEGWIDEARDSAELRMLARAFVNETPVRKRGRRFFQRLSTELANLPAYSQASGLFHFNRGALKQAEAALRRASANGGLLATLALFETLRRQNRESEIAGLLSGVDPKTLHGTPREKMMFARAMRDGGSDTEAAAFAYEVLLSAPNDPEAVLGYFGVFIEDPRGGMIPHIDKVGIDTWVRLEADDSSHAELLIVEAEARPSEGVVTPDHELAGRAMGLAVGEEFIVRRPTGDRTWRVAKIKHKYLHAFHDVTENFETRFPAAKGLWRMTMAEGDVQPALDFVKRAAEADRKVADLYLEKGFALNMVAAHVTGSTVAFADYIRSAGHDIQTTRGLSAERNAADGLIRARHSGGAVLDTYTAWTVATMDALDVLVQVFGTVAVPQSTIDELHRVRDRFRARGERESMTIGWHDGQFVRQIVTADEAADQVRYVETQIDKICTACAVEPVEAPDGLSPLAEAIVDAFDSQVFDAAYLAEGGRLLISEDMYYRSAVGAALMVDSVWLQPVLIWARDQGLLTAEAYAELLVQLAWRRHTHLGVDALSFIIILRQDDSEDLTDFRQLCRYLGGPTADMISHLSVSTNLINGLWLDKDLPRLKVMKATSILLAALIREPSRDWAQVLVALRQGLRGDPALFVWQWAQGHFLPLSALRAAEGLFNSPEGLVVTQAIRRYGQKSRLR